MYYNGECVIFIPKSGGLCVVKKSGCVEYRVKGEREDYAFPPTKDFSPKLVAEGKCQKFRHSLYPMDRLTHSTRWTHTRTHSLESAGKLRVLLLHFQLCPCGLGV